MHLKLTMRRFIMHVVRFRKSSQTLLEVGDVKDFEKFAKDNQSWLELFAEYMAIKEHFDNLAWTEWPDADARARKASALESYREKLADKLVYSP